METRHLRGWHRGVLPLQPFSVWALLRPETPAPVMRYGVSFAPGQELVDELNPTFTIAPDGSWIVYVGPGAEGGQLWVKPRDSYEAMPLPGTQGARGPSVSPDGAWIAFTAGGRLRKVPADGGPPITLVDSVNTVAQGPAAWLDDGTLAYVDRAYNVSRTLWGGGPPEVLFRSDSLYKHLCRRLARLARFARRTL